MSQNLIGIIFDLDGTLCNSEELAFEATNKVLQNHGIEKHVSMDEYREGARYPTQQRLAWHATADPEDSVGVDLCHDFDAYYINLVSESNPPFYQGIISLLSSLKDISDVRMGVLSNASVEYVTRVVEVQGLQHMFCSLLGIGGDLTVGKPHPEGLNMICAVNLLLPLRCVYVGDSPTDGRAAAAAGMRSIGVSWGNCSRAVLSGTHHICIAMLYYSDLVSYHLIVIVIVTSLISCQSTST
jgi:HAD superfamily hydrolase (TIGR01549 family)